MERVSFGKGVNKESDDVAGLAISESLRSGIRTLKEAERNANEGVSLINIIEEIENSFKSISNARESA